MQHKAPAQTQMSNNEAAAFRAEIKSLISKGIVVETQQKWAIPVPHFYNN